MQTNDVHYFQAKKGHMNGLSHPVINIKTKS